MMESSHVLSYYEDGIEAENGECKTFGYHKKHADLGDARAMDMVGYYYQRGLGVKKDEYKAFEYYQKSAELGNVGGIFHVGYCYENGIGIEKNEHQALIYFQKSAKMGHANGAFSVGNYYEKGIKVEKNENKAFIYYKKSAKMGSVRGTFRIGYCYEYGIGIEKDECKAFSYYKKSADMKDSQGTKEVGCCYEKGIGVKKDENKAFEYYLKSANMGNATGTCCVGHCYQYGIGVDKQVNKAFEYYEKSAEMDEPHGTFRVGYCYGNGIGVEKNEHEAFKYYQKSAEMGDAKGTYYIGYCYENGISVKNDYYKAFYYYQKSASMGYEKGKIKADYYLKNVIEDNTSKNLKYWLEDAIANDHINYFEFSSFTNNDYIAEGGFGKVYKYLWKNCRLTVALKCLKVKNDFDEKDVKDFVRELRSLRKVDCHPNIIRFYGVTKDNDGSYNLILQYANEGTLREYLKTNFTGLQWPNKIHIATEIACGLLFLHDNNIIHRDLHSKNILIDQNQPKIADFGLSKQIDRKSITNSDSSINGMMPYIEPKCFSDYDPKYKRNKKSDVYSFGVILWEISSGRPPFQYFTNEMVIVQVFQGKREEPIEGTPSKYVELYKKCWDMEPVNRPETKLIFEFLNQIKPIKYGHTSLSSNRDYIEV